MQVQLDTDHNIEANEELAAHVKGVVDGALRRFSDRITRVEVHLSSQNGDKGGLGDNSIGRRREDFATPAPIVVTR